MNWQEYQHNQFEAIKLARWLIEIQKVDRTKAYIIAMHKYHLRSYAEVRAGLNALWRQEKADRQPALF